VKLASVERFIDCFFRPRSPSMSLFSLEVLSPLAFFFLVFLRLEG